MCRMGVVLIPNRGTKAQKKEKRKYKRVGKMENERVGGAVKTQQTTTTKEDTGIVVLLNKNKNERKAQRTKKMK